MFCSGNLATEAAQRALNDLLAGKHIPATQIDGSNADNKDLRSKLFEISGQRAVYPQLFALAPDGFYTFLGTGAQIAEMVEADADSHQLTALLADLKRSA